MPTSTTRVAVLVLAAATVLWGLSPPATLAGQRPTARRAAKAPEEEFAARRLLKHATDLLLAKEHERAVKMFETIIEQYPDSPVRFHAYLALGKHFLENREQLKAVGTFRHLNALVRRDGELAGQDKELYLEGLYLTGVAHYQMRQFATAFPILRKITNQYANTVWANQSYYYIGMCHFAQSNWSKAIKALSLVGTFVDPASPTLEYAEAGRRFYVKIEDADLPVLIRLGKDVAVAVETKNGDKETLPCIPLAGRQGIFISSIATAVAPAKPGDDVLQVIGGDLITTRYVDVNTQEGAKDVVREKKVQVVSTAALRFTLGTYEAKASAAFLGQPLFVLLHDIDQDASAKAESVEVKVFSRYKEAEEEATTAEGLAAMAFHEEAKYKVRDQVTLKLSELGTPPVHSGRFGGSVPLAAVREGRAADKTDQVLSCALNDEIVASYVDELHLGGEVPREVLGRIIVIGEIDGRPRATQNIVPDAVLRSRRDLVEATAFLELARIFDSMGLKKGAKQKAAEGLERVDAIIRLRTPIPTALREEAFKTKWELYIVQEDLNRAIATCKLFHRLYPDSPFVDQALMGIAKIKLENKEYAEALTVLRQIQSLPHSQAKAEAQFLIAQATEARSPDMAEAAIQQYKLCADRYPESAFAGKALAKLIDYYYTTRDYTRAEDLLEQVFQDYPDGDFLDKMLLKWVVVAYRMGDYQKAYDKCNQVLFEYPGSEAAKLAKKHLPKIERKLKKPTENKEG